MKLLIQLADNLVEKGHAHVSELKRWVSTVDRRYRDFSLRMAKYQESLEKSLGVSSEVTPHTLHPQQTAGTVRCLRRNIAAFLCTLSRARVSPCRTTRTWSWTSFPPVLPTTLR